MNISDRETNIQTNKYCKQKLKKMYFLVLLYCYYVHAYKTKVREHTEFIFFEILQFNSIQYSI